MKKKDVIQQLEAFLVDELAAIADSDVETDKVRMAEIHRQLLMYRFLPAREYGADDVVCPTALVELELNGVQAFYFVVPQGGGLVTRVGGKAVQVITPQSPLGEALLGRKTGDSVEVEVSGKTRRYRVVGIS